MYNYKTTKEKLCFDWLLPRTVMLDAWMKTYLNIEQNIKKKEKKPSQISNSISLSFSFFACWENEWAKT